MAGHGSVREIRTHEIRTQIPPTNWMHRPAPQPAIRRCSVRIPIQFQSVSSLLCLPSPPPSSMEVASQTATLSATSIRAIYEGRLIHTAHTAHTTCSIILLEQLCCHQAAVSTCLDSCPAARVRTSIVLRRTSVYTNGMMCNTWGGQGD